MPDSLRTTGRMVEPYRGIGSPRVKAKAFTLPGTGHIWVIRTQHTHDAAIDSPMGMSHLSNPWLSRSLADRPDSVYLGVYQCRCFLGAAHAGPSATSIGALTLKRQSP